jgi:ribonuclease T1
MRRSARVGAITFGICLTVVGLVAGLVLLQKTGDLSSPGSSGASASTSVANDGTRTVSTRDLPKEARATLDRIAAGGPYPYAQDGTVFQNREQLLPAMPSGYYREFTVPDPKAGDRGARRIVTGAAGERYYTDDHYESFARIEDAR